MCKECRDAPNLRVKHTDRKTKEAGDKWTYYHDIRPIINDLEYAHNLNDIVIAKDKLVDLIQKYTEYGCNDWAKANEVAGIHTWTWGEVRPMLINTQTEIEDFEKHYICRPETAIETTSNSQDIKAWEIIRIKNTNGAFSRRGIRPITDEPRKFEIKAVK
jgi:hypothetical protein